NKKMLNKNEINWINKYHSRVRKNLLKFMSFQEKVDLTKACSPI
ncbi:MAG: M24 family metallopeptidase C-terminal domain-containing protein, partial [Pelagibacteraceae bacterium]|nr:M24 family metallopeptidase C-terminal domain-containing protein [Pelagibacteraceae bacterium]